MRGSRTVSTIACASVQASWTFGNCFLNMFLNMVDTLIGAGAYRTLNLGRAHPLLGASTCCIPTMCGRRLNLMLEMSQTTPLPEQSTSVPKTEVAALRPDACFAPVSRHCQAVPACPKSGREGDMRNNLLGILGSPARYESCPADCHLNSSGRGSEMNPSRFGMSTFGRLLASSTADLSMIFPSARM